MSFTVDVEVLGTDQIRRRLLRIGENLDDMRPAWERVLALFEGQAADQFATKGGQSGGWPERSGYGRDSSGGAAGRLRGRGGRFASYSWPLMEKTGALLEGLTNQPSSNATNDGINFSASPDTPYWVYHHSTEPRKSNLPRRPLLVVDEQLRRQVMRTLQAHTFAG